MLVCGCGRQASDQPRVAIIQLVPSVTHDEGVVGISEGLSANGCRDGETVRLVRFNALGDIALLNAICGQVVASDYAVAVTVSTSALQAMAYANRDGRGIHVFGLVTDPFTAGVGLDRAAPAASRWRTGSGWRAGSIRRCGASA